MQRYYAAKASEIREGQKQLVRIREMDIGLFRVNGQLYAWRSVCPHAAAPVCRGVVTGTRLPSLVYEYEYGNEGQILRCPWHGWEFDLQTGKHLVDPGVKLRGYEVEIDDDDVYIILSNRDKYAPQE